MPYPSANWRMANRLAGGDLDAKLSRLRARGLSLDRIAGQLAADHGIEVTATTLAKWISALPPAEEVTP